MKSKRLVVGVSIAIMAILFLIVSFALLRGQTVKRVDFRKFVVEFWPTQRAPMPEDGPKRTKIDHNPTVSQYNQGNQNANVNVGPGGTANFNYGVPKSGKKK